MDYTYLSSACPLNDFIDRQRFSVSTEVNGYTTIIRFGVGDIGPGVVTDEMLAGVERDKEVRTAMARILIAKISLVLQNLQQVAHSSNEIIRLVAADAPKTDIAIEVALLAKSLLSVDLSREFEAKWANFIRLTGIVAS